MKYFYLIITLLLSALSSRSQTINLDSLKSKDNLLLYSGKPYTGNYFKNQRNCSGLFVFQEGQIINGLFEGVTTFKNSKKELLGEGKYINGAKQGFWIEVEAHWQECDEPWYTVSKGEYSNGLKKGKWEEGFSMWQFGTSIGNYKNGLKEGVWKAYRINKKNKKIKLSEGVYVNGKKEGEWKEWDDYNGNIRVVRNYKNDELNGKYVLYFDYKAIIKNTGSYINNKKNGAWIEHINEAYYSKGNYENDLKDGIWLTYFEVNNKVELRSLSYYEGGKIKNRIDYNTYKNGIKEITYGLFDNVERLDSVFKIKNDTLIETEKYNYVSNDKDHFSRKNVFYGYKKGKLYQKTISVQDQDNKLLSKVIVINDTLKSEIKHNYNFAGTGTAPEGSERTVFNDTEKPLITTLYDRNFIPKKITKYEYDNPNQIKKEITTYKDGTHFNDAGVPTYKLFYINDKLTKEIKYTYNELGQVSETVIQHD